MLKDALITDIASCLDSPGFMFRDPFLLVIHEVMVANDGRWTLLYIPEAESDRGERREEALDDTDDQKPRTPFDEL